MTYHCWKACVSVGAASAALAVAVSGVVSAVASAGAAAAAPAPGFGSQLLALMCTCRMLLVVAAAAEPAFAEMAALSKTAELTWRFACCPFQGTFRSFQVFGVRMISHPT